MTTSQNAPAPQQGRHRTATSVPSAEHAGPRSGQYPVRDPRAGFPQAPGRFPGQAQRSDPIPAQWGPSSYQPQSGPTQHPARPFPGPHVPAQHSPAHLPAQPLPARVAALPAQAYAAPAATSTATPRNGSGIAAVCLGIVGMLFGLVPFTGLIAFGLGAVGIVLGLVGFARARRRTATNTKTAVSGVILSILSVALGIWGMVILFAGLNQLSQHPSQIPSSSATTTSGGKAVSTDITTPATTPPRTYQLEVTGDASKMMVGYGTNNATSSASDYQSLPWRKTIEAAGDYPYASLTASSFGPGSITCTITDTATGAVVATQTSKSLDGGEYSSATVSCNTMG